MKMVKSIIMAVVVAGSMAVQAEARDHGVNGWVAGGYAAAQPAVFLPPPPPPPNIIFDFGGRDHRYYRPAERCRDIVTVKCWYGRCREVVRTECRDRWRHRDWRDYDRYDRHRDWHDDRRWHDDDRWRDDRWRDRPYPRDRW